MEWKKKEQQLSKDRKVNLKKKSDSEVTEKLLRLINNHVDYGSNQMWALYVGKIKIKSNVGCGFWDE